MAKDSFNSVSGPKVQDVPAAPTRFASHFKTDKRGREIKTEEDVATTQIPGGDGTMHTVRAGKKIAVSAPKNKP